MSFAVAEIWNRISEAGLASPQQMAEWRDSVSEIDSVKHDANGLRVLQRLIEKGKLTKYQAKVLAGQTQGPLRCGPLLVKQIRKAGIWTGWADVVTAAPSSKQGRVARWFTSDDLRAMEESTGSRASGASLNRFRTLSELTDVGLVPMLKPEVVDYQSSFGRRAVPALQVHMTLGAGATLAAEFGGEPPNSIHAFEIARQTLASVSALHTAGIVHGRLAPDRVFWDGKHTLLVSDPLSVETLVPILDTESTKVSNGFGIALTVECSSIEAATFAAPELGIGGQTATYRSDVFALGKLFRWLMGWRDEQQVSVEAAMALNGTPFSVPDNPAVSSELKRVLEHATAPDPSCRFESAGKMFEALLSAAAVQKGIRSAPVAKDKSPEKAAKPRSTPQDSGQSKPHDSTPQSAVQSAGKGSADARRPTKEPKAIQEPKHDGRNRTGDRKQEVTKSGKRQSAKSNLPTDPMVAESKARGPSTAGGTANHERPRRGTRKRRRASNKWMLPVFGGAGFLMVLLLILKMSGALGPTSEDLAEKPRPKYVPPPKQVEPKADPLDPYFELVSDDDSLWAPPFPPQPIPLDLLPPGAGGFLNLRSEALDQNFETAEVYATLLPMKQWSQSLSELVGIPLASVDSVVIGLYDPETEGGVPRIACRVRLSEPMSKQQLAESTEIGSDFEWNQLIESRSKSFFFRDKGDTTCQEFSVGPTVLMVDVESLNGGAGPLQRSLETLQKGTSLEATVTLLGSTPFLFGEGRSLLGGISARSRELVDRVLTESVRGFALTMNYDSPSYMELRLVGAGTKDAAAIARGLEEQTSSLPGKIEAWFVNETPHVYWRALALRYPQMLRVFNDLLRIGVEDGVAIGNVYLPEVAANNLIVASSIAVQDTATLQSESSVPSSTASGGVALSVNEILALPITLQFDQEPIEVALRLIGDEANDALSASPEELVFTLDGGAFELAGITRNMQVRNFEQRNVGLRDVLTKLAQLGNNVTGVEDLTSDDQNLLWVIRKSKTALGKGTYEVVLTTRAAATKEGIPLPSEFANP
ncbi:MAG: hypothetical protein AB8B50_12530 [Pirellulaceae bacterium]